MAKMDKLVGEAIVAAIRASASRLRTDGGRSGWGRFLITCVWQAVACALLAFLLGAVHLSFATILWFAWLIVVWLTRRAYIVERWVHGYRMTLAGDALKYPGHRVAYKFWKAEKANRAMLRKQWAAACSTLGIKNAAKMTPPLTQMRTLSNGDMTAVIHPGPLAVKGGVREIRANREDIAATCGCEGGITVQPFGSGLTNQAASAQVTFIFEARKWPRLPIQQLPPSPEDRISIGNDRGLKVASIPFLSVLLVAMTGMGKSKAIYAIFVGIEQKVRSTFFVVDPKGGQQMSKFRSLVNKLIGRRTYADYAADSEEGAYRVILAADEAAKRQQRAMAAKHIDEWLPSMSDEFPLIVLVIDEMLELLDKITAANKPGKEAEAALKSMLSQGRSAGVMVVMAAQVSDKEILGHSRTLIKTRIVLGTESASQTAMAFGDTKAEENGALCSQINEAGIAYIREDGKRGYREIRIAHVDNEDVEQITLTGMPAGMGDDGSDKVESWKPHWNYRYFSSGQFVTEDGSVVAPGQLVYVGETNLPVRRHNEHVRDFQAGKRDAWMKYTDLSKRPLITYAPNEAAALKVQSFEIAEYAPVGNVVENKRSPWFGQPPVATRAKRGLLGRTQRMAPASPIAVRVPAAVAPAPAEYLKPRPAVAPEPRPELVEASNVAPIRQRDRRPAPQGYTRTRTRRTA